MTCQKALKERRLEYQTTRNILPVSAISHNKVPHLMLSSRDECQHPCIYWLLLEERIKFKIPLLGRVLLVGTVQSFMYQGALCTSLNPTAPVTVALIDEICRCSGIEHQLDLTVPCGALDLPLGTVTCCSASNIFKLSQNALRKVRWSCSPFCEELKTHFIKCFATIHTYAITRLSPPSIRTVSSD